MFCYGWREYEFHNLVEESLKILISQTLLLSKNKKNKAN